MKTGSCVYELRRHVAPPADSNVNCRKRQLALAIPQAAACARDNVQLSRNWAEKAGEDYRFRARAARHNHNNTADGRTAKWTIS